MYSGEDGRGHANGAGHAHRVTMESMRSSASSTSARSPVAGSSIQPMCNAEGATSNRRTNSCFLRVTITTFFFATARDDSAASLGKDAEPALTVPELTPVCLPPLRSPSVLGGAEEGAAAA